MKLDVKVLRAIVENSYVKGSNVYGKCPWCSYNEFGISINENHQFGCFRKKECGETGNIFKFLKKIDRTDLIERELIVIKDKLITTLDDEENASTSENSLKIIKPPIGWKRCYSNDYIDNRIDNFNYDKYKVGVTKLDNSLRDYVIILIEENSQVIGYVSRYTGQELDKQKYRNSKTDFSQTILGLEDVKDLDNVILVEGPFDKWVVDNYLFELKLLNYKCICTFGAKFSEKQKSKLKEKKVSSVILMFESDVLQKVKDVSVDLEIEFDKALVCYLPKDEDPGSMSLSSFKEVLSKARKPSAFYSKKVNLLNLK